MNRDQKNVQRKRTLRIQKIKTLKPECQISDVQFEYPLNAEEEAMIEKIELFQTSNLKYALFILLSICTGGIVFLYCYWNQNAKIFLQLNKCTDAKTANAYLITAKGKNDITIPEQTIYQIFIKEILSPFYVFQLASVFLWLYDQYRPYAILLILISGCSIILTIIQTKGTMRKLREMSHFETDINVYRKLHHNVYELMPEEEYQEQQQNNHNPSRQSLHDLSVELDMQQQKEDFKKNCVVIKSTELVPGDIIEVPENQFLPCDVVLLNGTAIVNESMLTGEATPVIKTALPYDSNKYDSQVENRINTLFAGTKCIETRYFEKRFIPVLGLVSETGFNTMKGQLLRSILYPKEQVFQFYKDSINFILFMGLFALLGFSWAFVQLLRQHDVFQDIMDKSMDIITVCVPPAMPTAMSIGISFALQRLRKKAIFCIAPSKINVCGRVNLMCFDKTGTLTEEGLDLLGVQTLEKIHFKQLLQPLNKNTNNDNLLSININQLNDINIPINIQYKFAPVLIEEKIDQIGTLCSIEGESQYKFNVVMLEIMATCHSLTTVHDTLIGDPLDIKMFEATKWTYDDHSYHKIDQVILACAKPAHSIDLHLKTDNNEIDSPPLFHDICVVKRFDFSSRLQRMSVIVSSVKEKNKQKFQLHVKGAPEKIRELCRPETVPKDFHTFLTIYGKNGFRMIACATKELNLNYRSLIKRDRTRLETNLTFVGILIFQNRLKPVTKDVITKLQQARVRTVMVTGDNALTAVSVARQCGIVPTDYKVYFGELQEHPSKMQSKNRVTWSDFDVASHALDPITLAPIEDIQQAKNTQNLQQLNQSEQTQNQMQYNLDQSQQQFQQQYQQNQTQVSNESEKAAQQEAVNNALRMKEHEEQILMEKNMTIFETTLDNENETIDIFSSSPKLSPAAINNKRPKQKKNFNYNLNQQEDVDQNANHVEMALTHLRKNKLQSSKSMIVPMELRFGMSGEINEEKGDNEEELPLPLQQPLLQKNAFSTFVEGEKEHARLGSQTDNKELEAEINQFEQQFIEKVPDWSNDEKIALAVTGNVFEQLIYDMEVSTTQYAAQIFHRVLDKAQIFARMKPEEKAYLIQYMQEFTKDDDNEGRQTLVGMCGDGANDCAALKTADVGLSLSDAEASIAASFTCKVQNIQCVLKLLREGRCALTTSFQCFKYMVLYSMIQFITVTLLYSVLTNLSNNQYLYNDMFLVFPLAVFMGYTKAYKQLTMYRPPSSLITPVVLISIIGQIVIQDSFQIIVFFILKSRTWYVACKNTIGFTPNNTDQCMETTTLFFMGNFQYIATAFTFSIGRPFRLNFYTNIWFTASILILFFISSYMLVQPQQYTVDLMHLIQFPSSWLIFLTIVIVLNTFLTYLYEKYLVNIIGIWFAKQQVEEDQDEDPLSKSF